MTDPVRVLAPRLADRIGWELHTAGEAWKTIVDVIASERNVLVVTDDQAMYTYRHVDGVRVRAPEALDECDGAGRD